MQRGASRVIGAVVLGAAFLVGYLVSTKGDAGWLAAAGAPATAREATPADRLSGGERRPAVVVLPAVLPSHPAWSQLAELTAEVAREQRSAATEQARVAETARRASSAPGGDAGAGADIAQARAGGRAETRSALEAAYERRQQTELTRIKTEAARKVAERKAILDAQVDEEVGVKRGKLKASLAAKVEEIRRAREAKLLSLQLRLGLASKGETASESDPLKDELSQVQGQIDSEIAAAQKESERQLSEYAAQVAARAQQDLEGFAAQVNAEAERQAVSTGESLRAQLVQKLDALGDAAQDDDPGQAVSGPAGSPKAAATTASRLLARRDSLQATIIADIRGLAAQMAKDRGLGTLRLVSNAADRPAGAVDLTQVVAGALQQAAGDTLPSAR